VEAHYKLFEKPKVRAAIHPRDRQRKSQGRRGGRATGSQRNYRQRAFMPDGKLRTGKGEKEQDTLELEIGARKRGTMKEKEGASRLGNTLQSRPA